ncbi:MAG: hypothetical protein VXX01_00950, partial [Pseudomonadota bacterium]|nr:hypothetical protein [Pseudomonadota bacterium]
ALRRSFCTCLNYPQALAHGWNNAIEDHQMQKAYCLAAAVVAVITLGFSGLSHAQSRSERYDSQIERLERYTAAFEEAECTTTTAETEAECTKLSSKIARALARLDHLTTKRDWVSGKLAAKSDRLVVLADALDAAEKRLVIFVREGESSSAKVSKLKERSANLREKVTRLKAKVSKLSGMI